mmetsp:Transcript_14309/g.21424  ORF Transcript_14309/g.21424 Transcript_14309/m.21424 type:complete len:359 (-) Transcript_14309:226-1302(-)
MGACGSRMTEEEKRNYLKNKEINEMMERNAKLEAEKIKLLLLGAGESGKSTIFKQMKVIYGKTFTEEERRQHTSTIYSNILTAIKILCDQAAVYNMVSKIEVQKSFELVKALDENDAITEDVGNAIKALWADPGIQEVWKRRSEYQIIESVKYYFDRIDVIASRDYIPQNEDIMYSRVRTSGIVTESYEIDGAKFEMYDVGGQRNERKKWIHCFEDVTAIIFVAALSEYDQKLFEDASANRMIEALDLFDEIINNAFFRKSSIILFLNKRDLFEEKVKTTPIRDTPAFSDYSGPDGDYDAGLSYFLKKFLARNKSGADHQIYHHATCATDTKNVRVVFNSCKDIILRENLKNSGFMDD